MLKRLVTSLCVLACLSAPVLSQQACDPAKLSAAIDRYAAEPFSARSWRMIKGLGDPMVDVGYYGADYWSWRDTWGKLATELTPGEAHLKDYGYDCRIGYPLEVLQQRIAKLGKDSSYVKQWLHVQDKVMEACTASDTTNLSLPDPMTVDQALTKTQDDDRVYQKASIAFYRDKEKALELFKAIGASNSEHKAAARYNVANLLANAKRLGEARKEANAILADTSLSNVHGITKELLGYIANLEDTAEGWTALIDRTIATIEAPLAVVTKSEESKAEYGTALYDIDYAGIRGKNDDWWLDGTLPENPTISKAIVDASRKYPMALWMMAGQSADKPYRAGPWNLIGDKWEAREATVIDKALAIQPSANGLPPAARDMLEAAKAKPDDATRKVLWDKAHAAIAAAERSCGDAPETAAAGYLLAQAVRVSAMSGHADEAIAELETVPFKTADAYYNGTLVRLGEYLLGQGDLKNSRSMRDKLLTPEFFAKLPEAAKTTASDRLAQFMGWVAEDREHWNAALALQSKKTANLLFNFLPAKMLWAYADNPMFSDDEKGLLARAAWTRGYARGQTQSSAQNAKLFTLNPKLKESADKVAADYPKANAQRQRLLNVLRNPRFGILVTAPGLWSGEGMEASGDTFAEIDSYDINDKNWWCSFAPDRQLGGLRTQFDEALGLDFIDQWGPGSDLKPVFDQAVRDKAAAAREAVLASHPMVKAIEWKELGSLSRMPSGPKQLSLSAIRWGKASHGDDGAPEALALAIRTTHYGCRWDGSHGPYSRAAHDLLQARFKDASWAKETPYWYGCMDQVYDKDYNKITVCEPRTWPKQLPLK